MHRYDYVPQQRILKKKWNPRKLGKRTSGPYRILQTHVNVTLTVELRPGVSERIHIRRVFRREVFSRKIIQDTIRTNALDYHVIKMKSICCMDRAVSLVLCQMMQGWTADKLPVLFQNLCCQAGLHVSGRPGVTSEFKFMIRKWFHCIEKHHPVIPAKLANLADASCPPFHNGIRDFTASQVIVIGSGRANQAFKLNAVIPFVLVILSSASSVRHHFWALWCFVWRPVAKGNKVPWPLCDNWPLSAYSKNPLGFVLLSHWRSFWEGHHCAWTKGKGLRGPHLCSAGKKHVPNQR